MKAMLKDQMEEDDIEALIQASKTPSHQLALTPSS